MTTGEPLVARVAMKPIPTLTKPLRSVDISTKEPAQALRERTDSCVVPGRGRRGGGDAGDRAGRRLPRQVRRRPHRRRARDGRRVLSSGSVEAPALVFIGFMGAGKTTGARAAAAALGVRAIDTDRELEQRLGTSIEDYFASHGERAFREIEEDVVAEVLETPPAPVISIGGGAIGSARVRELLARHTVVMLDVDEPTAWRRAGGKRRPLARDRERFAALHAERAPIYEALADAVLLDGGAETVRRAAGALRRIPTGVEGPVGGRGRAQLPGLRRRRARRRLLAACAVGASCSPTRPSDALLRRADPGGRRHASRCRRARRPRRWRTPRRCCAGWPPPGWTTTTTWSRSAAAWSATSRASAPRSTSAASASCRCRRRSSPRSTRPTAARPGWTCPRARTTSAPTTSRAPCWPTRGRWRRCRPRSWPPAGPR